MKIAMLTNNYKPFVGGVPISVERQARELVKLGHEVTVFAPAYEGVGKTEFDKGIRVIRFSTGKRCMKNGMVYPKLILKEIIEVFEKEVFDLIHTHHPMFVGLAALYLGRKYHLPVVYTYHTRYEDYLHYLNFLQKKCFPVVRKWLLKWGKEVFVPKYMCWFTNQCDLVLTPTTGMQRRIRENGTRVSTAVFPTGLEQEFYLEYPEEVREIRRKYLPNGGLLFCTTGRLEEEKNPRFLLSGIKMLKAKVRDPFRVLFVGDGSMRSVLEKEVHDMGSADVVEFLGNVPNSQVNRYLQASDVFLFTSKSETQGIVLVEAFASGCPVVAVRASGVEDIVKDGVNGFQTEEDADVWSDKVLEVLKCKDMMREQAKVTASAFRSERLAVYEELLYRQCIAEKESRQETETYEYESDRTECASEGVYQLFKIS